MQKLQSQGVHHITLVGADRQTSIDFWEGLLGMPFVFEQPNLDNPGESHLYFDPGDGRLITVFTNEDRTPDPRRTPTDPGCVHHIAISLSKATFDQAVERLEARGIEHSGVKDRGFMDSIYFDDPLGLTIELAAYRFEPPHGFTHGGGAARGAQAPRSRAATITSRRPTSPMRSRISCSARASRCRTIARRRTRTDALTSAPGARPPRDMAETASCAGGGAGSSVERMSTVELERPSPTGTAARHAVSGAAPGRCGPSSRRAARSRSTISPSCSRRGGSAAPPRSTLGPPPRRAGSMHARRRPPGSSAQGSRRSMPIGGRT